MGTSKKELCRRTASQRDKDLQITAELYLAGRNQYEIAEVIGVSQGTISNDLKAIRAMWRERAVIAFSERKAEELARLDKLEREYWQAWERSIKPVKSKSKKVKTFADSLDSTEITKKKEARDGNPSFLAGVERCIKQRMEILHYADLIERLEVLEAEK